MTSTVAVNLLVVWHGLWFLAHDTDISQIRPEWMASDAAIAPHEGVGPPETGSDRGYRDFFSLP